MTYNELSNIARKGKIGLLPNFKGYFKWDYANNELSFSNKDFTYKAKDLDILNRTDFYYII